ncbi:hypothetical protein HDU98_000584, partial [Podochytrium sp. JEL0797]
MTTSPTASPRPSARRDPLQIAQRLTIMIDLWNALQHTPYAANDRAQLCRGLARIQANGHCDTLNPYGQEDEDVFYACFLFLNGAARVAFLEEAREAVKEGRGLEADVVKKVVMGKRD